MKAFVDWLLARRYRLVLLAVAFAPLLPMVAAALMALETARNGLSRGLASAAFGVAGVLLIAFVSGANPAVLAFLGMLSLGAGVAIGALLIRGEGSLTLAFQGVVLFCALIVAVMGTIGPDPRVLFAPVVDELVRLLSVQGAEPAQVEAVRTWEGMLIGLLIAAIFAQLVAALLLAHWWFALAGTEVRFGAQFRSLKLGRVLGIPAMVMLAVGLVSDALLVQNLSLLALFAFLFQGLAVLHAWAHARNWHPVFVAPIYVLLVTPLTGLVLLGLSSIGLVDNLFDLRAPLRAGI